MTTENNNLQLALQAANETIRQLENVILGHERTIIELTEENDRLFNERNDLARGHVYLPSGKIPPTDTQ